MKGGAGTIGWRMSRGCIWTLDFAPYRPARVVARVLLLREVADGAAHWMRSLPLDSRPEYHRRESSPLLVTAASAPIQQVLNSRSAETNTRQHS